MKSKLVTIVMVVVLALSLSIPAFAAATGANYDGQYYIQRGDTVRYMSEASLSWGTKPIYVVYESDGVRFCCDRLIYKVNRDGTYDSMSGGKSSFNYSTNNKEWYYTYKFTYPVTFDGVTCNDRADFENLKSSQWSGSGAYLLLDSTTDYQEATNFFRLPLLETMKVQQGKAVEIPLHLASWVRSLMPLGISCLVLLLLVPILSKVLRIFLH